MRVCIVLKYNFYVQKKGHTFAESLQVIRQLNKSLRICDIRLTTSDIAYGSDIRLWRVMDLFNITATASRNLTQEFSCISLLAIRLKI